MITIPLSLLTTHFLADFVFQSNWMAINKTKRLDALSLHVLIYSLCFLWLGWLFTGITFLTHFVTDFVTSRWTSRLWPFIKAHPDNKVDRFYYDVEGMGSKRSRHWFFVVIGFDQL